MPPFQTGHQGPRKGRPHALADAEYAKQVAALFVAGTSRKEMAETLGVGEDTIGRWRRDPRVKAHAMKMVEDRVIAITRRVDSAIEARLAHAEKLSIKDLLDIRKEFLGGSLRQQTERADEDTVSQGLAALEANPDLIEQLSELVERQPPKLEAVPDPQE